MKANLLILTITVLPVFGQTKFVNRASSGLSFAPAVTYNTGGAATNSVAVADVNGDGKPDIVVANSCVSAANCSGRGTAGSVGVLLGNGDGTFQTATAYGSGGNDAWAVAVADVNGDGKADIVVANRCPDGNCGGNGDGIVSVLLGNGDGTFQLAVPYDAGGWSTFSVAVADVNDDGKPDIIVADYFASYGNDDGVVGVLLGNGDGTFQEAVTYFSGGGSTESVVAADVNGDGFPDLIVANCGSGSNCDNSGTAGVLLNNGDGTFQPAKTYSSGYASSVAVGDVNGDGRPDLVLADICEDEACDAGVNVLLGNGDGTFQAATSYSSGGRGSYSVAVVDVNGDHKPDIEVSNGDACGSCTNGSAGVLLNTTSFSPSLATLANFDGANGDNPVLMTLVQGTDGTFYGTTFGGGVNNDGTVFKITPGGVLTTLYSFCMRTNCTDGSNPESGLVLATDGNFYGTTTAGGTNEDGTVFEITPEGMLTTVHNFDVSDGAAPWGKLIQAVDGDYYGTTFGGGAHGGGTVFKITSNGILTTLYSFCAQTDCADGANPEAGLVQSTNGTFFGTTASNGGNFGTIFEITSLGALTTLHRFDGADGAQPVGTLIQATDSNFYGTTQHGGPLGFGTVFRITPTGKLTTMHSFNSTDGANPTAGLIQATDGNLYGTTASGGTSNDGTIFGIAKGDIVTTLHNFTGADGAHPQGGLLESTSGVLYGTTSQGGHGSSGTVYGLTIDLGPSVAFVRGAGKVGQTGPILGQGFAGTSGVRLNAVAAKFKVVSDTLILATVPEGAATGYVTVTTPAGLLKSNVPFRVIP